MAKAGGAVSTAAVTRLVHTIGVIRWIALTLIALGALGGTMLGLSSGDFGGPVSVFVWAYGAVAALSVYVFMGWLQQALHMLVGIAPNTAKDDRLSRIRGPRTARQRGPQAERGAGAGALIV